MLGRMYYVHRVLKPTFLTNSGSKPRHQEIIQLEMVGKRFIARGSSDLSKVSRSWMFTTKSTSGLKKASLSNADVIVLDMEDSVPMNKKTEIRKVYRMALHDGYFKGREVVVRINRDEHIAEVLKDIDLLGYQEVSFMIPKCSVNFSHMVDCLLTNHETTRGLPPNTFKLMPIIECPSGLAEVREIALSSQRNRALLTGTADFSLEAGSEEYSITGQSFLAQVVLAAKEAGLLAIAGPYLYLDDFVGAERHFKLMKGLGFDGVIVLTPSHIQLANNVFRPSLEELRESRIIREAKENNQSTVQFDVQKSKMLAPLPTQAKAEKVLSFEKECHIKDPRDKSKLMPVRILRDRGLQDSVSIGQVITSDLELTLTETHRVQWESSFLTSSKLTTSTVFAAQLGLEQCTYPLLFTNMLTLGLCLSKFTQSAVVHLGCYNAIQLNPLKAGDTVKTVCTIRNARHVTGQDGQIKYTIVESRHELVNQDGVRVFRTDTRTLFPPLSIVDRRENSEVGEDENITTPHVLWKEQILNHLSNSEIRKTLEPTLGRIPLLKPGDLLLHTDVKTFGRSETTSLCNMFRLTNPHHHNSIRYTDTEILIPGPLVTAGVVSNTELDLGKVLYEEYLCHENLNKVNPGDMISTLTYVISVESVPESDVLEVVTVCHIGVKNTDLELLVDSEGGVTRELFDGAARKPADFEEICVGQCPLLYRKIVSHVEREVLRLKPTGEI